MAAKTAIAWTDATFNIAWGCQKVSPGCQNCYADALALRYGHDLWGPTAVRRTFGAKHWTEPLKWNREAGRTRTSTRVFSSSMCDIGEDHPTIAAERERLWPLIRATPWLDWQLLTKRAQRLAEILPDDWGPTGYPNVWLGVSIENQDYAWRADCLRGLPAAVRFVSYEPALGPLELDLSDIDWVIYGGESGPGFRAMDEQWARDMHRACLEAGSAFFFKQSAAPRTEMGTLLDGRLVREYPIPRKRLGSDAARSWVSPLSSPTGR